MGVIKVMTQKITRLAKGLRKQSTDVENLIWRHLQRKQLVGLKFRRQQPIGNFIVYFICFDKKVVVELDGGQHATEEKERDCKRDRWLTEQGFKVLRFWNDEVLGNINGVLEIIKGNCLNHPPHDPLPSREGKTREGMVHSL